MATPNTSVALREHNLVTTILGVFVQRVGEDPAVTAGLAAAESAKGMLISSDADAAALADTAKTIATAIKAVEAHKKRVLELPKMMQTVVGEHEKTRLAVLDAGRAACSDALRAWNRQVEAEAKRRRDEQAAENARLAREEQTRRDAAAAAGAPAEEGPVVPLEGDSEIRRAQPIRGGSGTVVFSKVLKAELVNVHDADPEWLEFKAGAARAWLRDAMKFGALSPEQVPSEETGEPVVVRGVKFWYEVGDSVR